jgi:hypothetical protein
VRAPRAIATALLVAALAATGCGGDDDEPRKPARPVEVAEAVPDLPPGWVVHRNLAAGFGFGLPPLWQAREEGTRTTIRSPFRLVVMRVSADRTNEALEVGLEEFATRVLSVASGYEEPLEPSSPRPFEHRYEGTQVEASGIAEDGGVRQDVRLIALRRDELVTLSVVINSNAEPAAATERRQALEIVDTLRTRPPQVAAGPDAL